MNADIGEVVLGEDGRMCGDTFIFEPSVAEERLGRLLVAAETEEKDGSGRELIDTVINALQREYYRDPTRSMLASLESALHQANLILHDVAEQGRREWMGTWQAAVGALAKGTLHVSTAGNGVILLARQRRLTSIAAGLSHSPITDPLRTFAQVASGVVNSRDVLFIGTSALAELFAPGDLARLAIDYSATAIATRLKQLYEDQREAAPLSVVVASLVPEHAVWPQAERAAAPARLPLGSSAHLTPRKPLTIHRSLLQRLLMLTGRLLSHGWRTFARVVWPAVKATSRRGGGALYQASRSAVPVVREKVHGLNWRRIPDFFRALPRSSKLFAGLVVVLAAALLLSLVLLRQKRVADEEFQRASEVLHEARTKKEAAEAALIYDNRDQARSLLAEAQSLTEQLTALQVYQEQAGALASEITATQDRLDKVTRVRPESTTEIGDFSSALSGANLTRLFYLQGALYTFNPSDNAIAKMEENGQTSVVSRTSQGIGFFTVGAAHEADKSLVLMTDAPGAALYDAKTSVVQKQEISFASSEAKAGAVSTFGNRVYLYDQTAHNIYGYTKTLRGYSGGEAWITAADFPRDTITDIGVDGYIYTLHSTGEIRKLLKGAPVAFTLEKLEEGFSPTARLHINEELGHLYVFDPEHKRVVVFDTVGNLSRQIFLGEESDPRDIAVNGDETTLYVLDGTKVKALSLAS